MPKTLHALINLYQFNVDEKRREIGGMMSVINDIERQASELESNMSEERAVAANFPEQAGHLFGNYTAHCMLKKEQFSAALQEMEAKLETAQEEIREHYRDLKGVELTQEAREKREAAERVRVEQAILDEIGLQAHTRGSCQ